MSVGRRPDDRDPAPPRWPAGRERRARAVIEALLADVGEGGALRPPPADECERLVRAFALWVASGSPNVWSGFRLFLFVLEILPPFLVGRWAPMTRLPLAERVAYLEAVERSRFGLLASLFVAVKLPIGVLAYEQGEALRLTGFDREGVASRRLPGVDREGNAARHLPTLPAGAPPAGGAR